MKRLVCALAAITCAAVAVSASAEDVPAVPAPQAVCVLPVAPVPYMKPDMPPKPAMPSCINMKTRISTCSQPVLKKYNTAIDAWNASFQRAMTGANDYIDALNKYSRANSDYNNCEITRINKMFAAE